MKLKAKKHGLPPATHPPTNYHLLFHNVDLNGYISIYEKKKSKQKGIIDTQVIFHLLTFMQPALQRVDKTIQQHTW